ncbi:MAG: EamA family transporter [bacterium]|nr:EamA family transporter [bacterium]
MWQTNAILAMLSMGLMALAIKKLTLQQVPATVILFFAFALSAVFYLAHSLISRTSLNLSGQSIVWILSVAVFSYLGNWLSVKSVITAPNPGYTMGIVGCSSLVILIGSLILFDSELSLVKGLGLLLCVAGGICISI